VASNLREPTWIAERAVVFVHPDGRRRDGRIAVGLPYMVSEAQARCPLILEGLETFPPQIAGSSTLQAMLLAARLAALRLHDFRARGGRIEYPGEEGGGEVDLDALFGAPFVECPSSDTLSPPRRP
jgi:hypothetical protein